MGFSKKKQILIRAIIAQHVSPEARNRSERASRLLKNRRTAGTAALRQKLPLELVRYGLTSFFGPCSQPWADVSSETYVEVKYIAMWT
jgi:hypothetical protein